MKDLFDIKKPRLMPKPEQKREQWRKDPVIIENAKQRDSLENRIIPKFILDNYDLFMLTTPFSGKIKLEFAEQLKRKIILQKRKKDV